MAKWDRQRKQAVRRGKRVGEGRKKRFSCSKAKFKVQAKCLCHKFAESKQVLTLQQCAAHTHAHSRIHAFTLTHTHTHSRIHALIPHTLTHTRAVRQDLLDSGLLKFSKRMTQLKSSVCDFKVGTICTIYSKLYSALHDRVRVLVQASLSLSLFFSIKFHSELHSS